MVARAAAREVVRGDEVVRAAVARAAVARGAEGRAVAAIQVILIAVGRLHHACMLPDAPLLLPEVRPSPLLDAHLIHCHLT